MSEVTEWQLQSARVTTFFLGGENPDPSGFWDRVVGTDPDEEHKRASSGQFQQIGIFEEWQLQLSTQPGRLDWSIGIPVQSKDSQEILNASRSGRPLDSAFTVVSDLGGKWVEICPATSRLALGAVLVQPVENRRSGYARLSKYLPGVEIDAEHSSDFNYQINRPRQSNILPDLTLNRLTKWGVILAGILRVAVTPGDRNLSTTGTEHGLSAMRLELDISTAGNRTEQLPHSDLPSLLHELIDLGKEIAASGDVP